MKSALDDRICTDLSIDSNVLPWLIEFASVLVNRYLVGRDGTTAFERLKGKPSRMLGHEFAEVVHFRRLPATGRLGKLDSLWQTGVLVGYKANTGEYMIVNHEGAYKTRTVRRAPLDDRWSKTNVGGAKRALWQV